MRLLITTQAVDLDDPALGFFHGWLKEFARHTESVEVICLTQGRHDLPANVRVHSLGKTSQDEKVRFVSRILYVVRFYRSIWKLRGDHDAVFVHMNPEYVVLGGLLWRLWRKNIGLWYVHKSVTPQLRIAIMLADLVFTVAPESFRVITRKLRVVGHGIDTELFIPAHKQMTSDRLRIVTIGRVSRSKGIDTMLKALDVLATNGVRFTFSIIGAPVTRADQSYAEALKAIIASKSYASDIVVKGGIPNRDLPAFLSDSDVFVNISATGGYDKAVLEALACGVPAISSSEPFRTLLKPYGLFVSDVVPESIAAAIEKAPLIDVGPLVAEVEKNHSLKSLIPKIIACYDSAT